MKMGKILTLIFLLVLFFSCVESDLPKQNGFLRIEFKEPSYLPYNKKNTPFKFYYNSSSVKLDQANDDQFIFDYTDLNLSLNLSYYEINHEKLLPNTLEIEPYKIVKKEKNPIRYSILNIYNL